MSPNGISRSTGAVMHEGRARAWDKLLDTLWHREVFPDRIAYGSLGGVGEPGIGLSNDDSD